MRTGQHHPSRILAAAVVQILSNGFALYHLMQVIVYVWDGAVLTQADAGGAGLGGRGVLRRARPVVFCDVQGL